MANDRKDESTKGGMLEKDRESCFCLVQITSNPQCLKCRRQLNPARDNPLTGSSASPARTSEASH